MKVSCQNTLKTERLILTPFEKVDTDSFAEINADEEVMRFFDQTMSYKETADVVEKIIEHFKMHNYGFWSVWDKRNGEKNQWLGIIMLMNKDEKSGLPNTPLVEIGWAFNKAAWGNGYAPEATKAVIDYAFTHTLLTKIYTHTTIINEPSLKVMKKVGFTNMNTDFIHSLVDEDSGLNEWCVWIMTKQDWVNKSC